MNSRSTRIPRTFSLAATTILGGLALLSGCGGGGTEDSSTPAPTGSGQLSVNIVWPQGESRVIPANALSIKIDLIRSGSTFRSLLIAKPATQANFTELPLGAMSVRATAYPTADGTGNALATTTVSATVSANAPTTVPLTMASTVASLTFSSATVSLAPGGTQNVTVTAKNASGGTVLVPASALTYTSNNPAFVKVTKNSDGSASLAHLVGVGTATITVTEAASGKTKTLPVTVATRISISPTTSTLSVGASATFLASVQGPSNTGVTWSVTEAGGGTISSTGVYTAPATKGTYHVVATSVADPTKKATATVTVQSGTGTVIVD